MATNKIYYTPGTAKTFKNTGGDVTLTLKNVANGAGRLSAQLDRGAGSLPARYKVEVVMKYAANVTIGLVSRIYLHAAENGSALVDGGTSDASIAAETQFGNFAFIGQNAAAALSVGPFYSSHIVEIYGRYVSVGVWNASGQATENLDGSSYVVLTPIPDDVQAAA